MRLSSQTALDIGRQILRAPFEDNGWDSALKALASHTRSARGELVIFGDDNSVPFNWITDLGEDGHREFVEIGGGNPDLNVRIAASKGPFEISYEADYDAVRTRIDSRVYDDYAHRHDMLYGCQAVLARGKGQLVGLAALRTEKNGRTTDEDRQAFAELAPFVLNAVELQQSVKHQGALMIAGTFDAMDTAAFILDARRAVQAQSNAATSLLRADKRLTVSGGRLSALTADDDRRLQAAIHRALTANESGLPGGTRVVLRGDCGPLSSLIVEVHPLPPQDWALGFEPRAVAVAKPTGASEMAGRMTLMEMLDLTPAEADVALAVASGLSREQIAMRRGTSLDTVNTQMKSLFRKSDVNREAHLVAILNQILR
ncbi:helix-turn-helix transcriptional regulator [Allosphingosinicella vermicomposti]|uniref:helix-turn-helix transcriptional regulator n=1 Tax=Allosphingosinicella vermicomposti TaxID=614671 RepID=UPI000D0FCA65|nr:helix-turn-helix transcriptional regulator [Allosphingosinicella vermicomposti]